MTRPIAMFRRLASHTSISNALFNPRLRKGSKAGPFFYHTLPFSPFREELANSSVQYDVIVGDLCDPVEDGPCYTLYTQSFYANILKPRLGPGGIFVTQAGPAGVLSAREVYSPIFNTLRQVFKCEFSLLM